MINKHTPLLLFLVSMMYSCVSGNENSTVSQWIEDLRAEVAPDKRIALWDLTFANDSLKGETDQLEGLDTLLSRMRDEKIEFTDAVTRLPDAALEGKTKALVTISVANIRSQPRHSAELATQALLGTPLSVLKKSDSWYLVQTPDRYLSWVDQAGIHLMTEPELEHWYREPKVVFNGFTGHALNSPRNGERVTDLVAGNILTLIEESENYLHISLPDGRTGWIPSDSAQPWDLWTASRSTSSENLIATAKTMMGVPYLWGGTSVKGVDCSGFTKTVFYLNGQIIPRDASQQVREGEEIDTAKDWDKLQVGDLLFFGSKATADRPERVVHVGMWIGDGQFIHSRGLVRISSFDPESPHYDEYELNRYLRTKRIINVPSENVLAVTELISSSPL